jgi:hypothetical protein
VTGRRIALGVLLTVLFVDLGLAAVLLSVAIIKAAR